jgi:hypothetical protein
LSANSRKRLNDTNRNLLFDSNKVILARVSRLFAPLGKDLHLECKESVYDPLQPKLRHLQPIFTATLLNRTRYKSIPMRDLTTILDPVGTGSRANPTEHRPEPPPRQMTFRQQPPIITRMFDQPSSGLPQRLLQLVSDQFSIPLGKPSRRADPLIREGRVCWQRR